jgi:hypothetical protein
MRSTLLILALGLVGPSMGCAGHAAAATVAADRPTADSGSRSPGGRHIVAVQRGAVYVDGQRIRAGGRAVEVLAAPTWRADGTAVAWTERGDGETRLVVLAQVGRGAEPMVWPLPGIADQDSVHWSGATKVVVGPSLLEPRAVANWSEQQVR